MKKEKKEKLDKRAKALKKQAKQDARAARKQAKSPKVKKEKKSKRAENPKKANPKPKKEKLPKQKKAGKKFPWKRREKASGKKAKLPIKFEIFAVTLVPLVLLAAIITVYTVHSMRSSLAEQTISGLRDLSTSVIGAYNTLDRGAYEMNDKYLRKGEYEITKNESMLDSFVKNSEVEVALYYGDTVAATSMTSHKTGKKINGEKAPADIVEAVINNKEEHTDNNAFINDRYYYAYYAPLKNPGGKVVGMILTVKPVKETDEMIRENTIGILIVAAILFVLAAIVVLLIASRIGRAVRRAGRLLHDISQGDLTVSIDNRMMKRKDELGLMAQALKGLMHELHGVLADIKNSSVVLSEAGQELNHFAGDTKITVNEVTMAVEDISRGALTQVEDFEKAPDHVSNMGLTIDQIVNEVGNLYQTSESMEQSKTDAENIIAELSASSEKTFEAIRMIENQVNLTDESVSKIQESVKLISSIAEETNMLSLNASIEAARAGDAGKGFGVVATEIQKLAEESNHSASTIDKVIRNLASESRNTVEAMEHMNGIMQEQQQKLRQTKMKFQDVSYGIQSSMSKIRDIRTESAACDDARENVTEVIRNLSSVTEQNASATEQTTASMDNLNTTIGVLAEKADQLETMAEKMQENLEFFKL